MLNKKQLLKEFFIYGLGSGLSRFFGLLVMPFFTRVLDQSQYGALDLSLSLVIMVSLIFSLQTESGMLRFYYEAEEKGEQIVLLSTVFWIWTGMAFLASFSLIILADYWARFIYSDIDKLGPTWVRLLGCNVFFHIQFHQLIHLLRLQHRAILFTTINSLPIVLFIFTSIIASYLKPGVASVLASLAFSNALSFLVLFIFCHKYIKFIFSRLYLKKVLGYSLPMVPSVMLNWGQRNGIRFVIIAFLSMSAMGLYGVADKMAMVVTMINRAFGQAWGPQSVKIMNREGSLGVYAQVFNFYIGATLICVTSLLIINPFALRVLVPEPYWDACNLSPLLICGTALLGMNTFAALGNIISKKTYRNLPGFTAGLVIILVGASWMLSISPSLQRIGEAFIVGCLICNIVLLKLSNGVVRIPYRPFTLYSGWATITLLGLVASRSYTSLIIMTPFVFALAILIVGSKQFKEFVMRIVSFLTRYSDD